MSQKQYSSSPAPSRLWSFMCHITLSIFFYGVLVYFLVSHTLSLMHYHIPVTRMFVSKFLECPTQVFEECGLVYPPPPMTIWSGLGTWDLSRSGVIPPPPPSESPYPFHPLPLENENLVRTRHLGFELVWSTPISPSRLMWVLVCGD